MAGSAYLNFDVLFGLSGSGYQAQVIQSPAGDGQLVTFERPFTDGMFEPSVLMVGRLTKGAGRDHAAQVAASKQTGGRLFDAIFGGAVGECLRRSIDRSRDTQATLRIRLRFAGCPELARLPWELLYDRSDDWFLALSGSTPVVRYMQLPVQPRAVPVTLPLRILVIRSEPDDYPSLHLEAEWALIAEALAGLGNAGLVTFTELAAPTLSDLRQALVRDSFHVLHYMGHGRFDEHDGGVLLFTDRAGRSVPVTSEGLGVMLRDHSSLRLAVLNACEAGRTDPANPFAGVAETLVRRGIPAVVAMLAEISDIAAVEFAPALYGALAVGHSIDTAVTEARKAMYAIGPLEWATPVLYLRADDGRLFDITHDAPPVPHAIPGSDARTGTYPAAGGSTGMSHAASDRAVVISGDNTGIVSTGDNATNTQIWRSGT